MRRAALLLCALMAASPALGQTTGVLTLFPTGAGGSGDITSVGDCSTGACFQATTATHAFMAPLAGGAATFRAITAADLPAELATDIEVSAAIDAHNVADAHHTWPLMANDVPYTPAVDTDWINPDPDEVGVALNVLADRLTVEEAKADDDVPESGDFGAGLALEADGSLSDDVVGLAELAACDGPGEMVEYGASGVPSCVPTPSGGGSDDQTAAEVPITDAGTFFTGADVEAALQEIGPTMTDARAPTGAAGGDLGGTYPDPTVDDDGHAHTGATLSGVDVSADTNLGGTSPIVVTGDDVTCPTCSTGSHFAPNTDPAVDHSGYVAGHGDGTDCSAGQYARGVDAAGNAELCAADDTGTDDQTAAEVGYSPAEGLDWGTDPDDTAEALDQLALRLTDEEAAGGGAIAVEEADGTPAVASVDTLVFNQADGFTVTDDTGGQVTVGFTGGGGGAVDYVLLQQSGTQSTTAGVFEVISWETEIEDASGYHAANSTDVVVPTDRGGVFHLACGLVWSTVTGGVKILEIRVNGTEVARLRVPGSSSTQELFSSTVYRLADADVVTCAGLQTVTGTVTIAAGPQTYLAVARIGD